MIVFPNSKINLGLNILSKRSDGYHELQTVFYPLALTDALEIIKQHQNGNTSLPFTSSGLAIPGNPASNLCVKAYQLLKKDFPAMPGVLIHLHKLIPAGAGLGGGSADAAFCLKLVKQICGLSLTNDQLIRYAAELGSDCPFFIINKPCFATGRGEKLEEIDVDLSGYKIVIVNPGIHIDTGKAFLNLHPRDPGKSIKTIIKQSPDTWKDDLKNDFEEIIFPDHPQIEKIKEELYTQGAVFALMSGTGSTVYGLFRKDQTISQKFPANYFIKELTCQ